MESSTHKIFSYKYLFFFSIPSLFSTLLEPLASIVDNALAGRMDTNLFAAVAIGSTIVTSFAWVFNFLTHVPTQRISKSFALNDKQGVINNLHSSLVIACGLGVICCLGLYFFSEAILRFSNTPREVFSMAQEYFEVRLFAVPLFLIFTVLLSLLRGVKRVKIVFILLFLVTGLNITLSYIFLYQLNMGAKGIALGTIFAHMTGIIISSLYIVINEKIPLIPKWKNLDLTALKELGQDGFNMFGRTAVLTLSFYLLTRSAAKIGTQSLAAYQLGLQGWLFSSFFIDGFAVSATILTSEQLAKNNFLGLQDLQIKLRNMCLGLGLFICAGLYFGKMMFFSFFTTDVTLLKIIAPSWWVICLSQIPLSYGYLLDGHLFGLGSYGFLRKHMFIGFMISVVPMLLLAESINLKLEYLWLTLLALGLYRFGSGCYYWYNWLNRKLNTGKYGI